MKGVKDGQFKLVTSSFSSYAVSVNSLKCAFEYCSLNCELELDSTYIERACKSFYNVLNRYLPRGVVVELWSIA